MAGIQLTGLASGMDWKGTVEQLMKLERVPQDRLKSQQSKGAEKQAALDKVKAAVTNLNTAVSNLDLGSITSGPRTAKISSSLALKSTAIPVSFLASFSSGSTTMTTSNPAASGVFGPSSGVYFTVSGDGIQPGSIVQSVTQNGNSWDIVIDPPTSAAGTNAWITCVYSGSGYETTTVPLSDTGTVTSEDGAATGSYEVRVLEPATESIVFGRNNGLVPDWNSVSDTKTDGYQFDCLTLSDYGVLEGDTIAVNGMPPYEITAADLALSAKAFLTARGGTQVVETDPTEIALRQKDGRLKMSFTNGGLVPFLGSAADSGEVLEKLGISYSAMNGNAAIYQQKIPSDALSKIKLSSFVSSSGSISINGTSISYSTTDTIGSLVGNINDSDSGVVAQLDADRRRLILRSTAVGGGPISLSDGGGVLAALGMEDTFGSQEDVTQQTWNPQDGDSPYDASDTNTYYKAGTPMTYSLIRNGKPVGSPGGSTLLVDGTNVGTFTAAGNTVDLSVHGFGKTKLSVTQAGTYKFQVSGSENNGRDKFDALIKAYNDLRTQVTDVTKVTIGSDGKVTAAVLSGNRDLVNMMTTMRSRLFSALEDPGTPTGIYSNFSSSYDRLERLGISFDRNGVLSISNASKLTEALRDYPSRVNALLSSGASYVSASGSAGNNYFTTSTLDNLTAGQTVSGAGIPSGTTITSVDTTTSTVYLSNSLTSTIASSKVYLPVVNQGLAVRLSGMIESLMDTSSSTPGLFKTSTSAITSEKTTLQKQIELMDRQLAARQAALERSFIAMEKAQARSQSMLSQLTNAFQKSS